MFAKQNLQGMFVSVDCCLRLGWGEGRTEEETILYAHCTCVDWQDEIWPFAVDLSR